MAAERGMDFEPASAPMIDALPGLTRLVEGVAARCPHAQERRWLDRGQVEDLMPDLFDPIRDRINGRQA